MLTITIPKCPDIELYDEVNNEFTTIIGLRQDVTLQLEHSLVSLSKWESKWHKPFLDCLEEGNLSLDETIDYIKCMTLNKNVDSHVYGFITEENMSSINAYISDPMTATTVPDINNGSSQRERITSELVYYWMIALQIPFECEKWHLARLITLIKVCNYKNQPPKKMSQSEIISRNRALNAARRKKLGSKG